MRPWTFLRIPTWLRLYFDIEAQADAREERRLPPDAPRLEEGMRVDFDLNQGEDGSYYATNVRPHGTPGEAGHPR
jgi:hypothetical protein